jgi:hypothetical protein
VEPYSKPWRSDPDAPLKMLVRSAPMIEKTPSP